MSERSVDPTPSTAQPREARRHCDCGEPLAFPRERRSGICRFCLDDIADRRQVQNVDDVFADEVLR